MIITNKGSVCKIWSHWRHDLRSHPYFYKRPSSSSPDLQVQTFKTLQAGKGNLSTKMCRVTPQSTTGLSPVETDPVYPYPRTKEQQKQSIWKKYNISQVLGRSFMSGSLPASQDRLPKVMLGYGNCMQSWSDPGETKWQWEINEWINYFLINQSRLWYQLILL